MEEQPDERNRAVTDVLQHRPCGRPTKRGKPCRQLVLGGGPCHRHRTSDEPRKAGRVSLAWFAAPPGFSAANDEEAGRAYRNRDPACWSWPAPQTCTFKDEESAVLFLHWWNRECAVCGLGDELVEDHDHQTGLIRGRLCRSCNSLEGHASDSYGVFRKYRERPPAVILGIRAQYWSPWTGQAEPEPEVSDEEAAAQWAAVRAVVDKMADRLPPLVDVPDET
jgi:Recombination endonuclease VII